MLPPRHVFLAALSCALAAACDREPHQNNPAAEPPAASVASAVPVSASPPSAVAPLDSAAAKPASSSLGGLFQGSPSADTRRSETVTGAGGVYAGLPSEWSTQDVYNDYLIAATKDAKAMVYLDTGSSLDTAALGSFVKGAAYPIHLKDIQWDSEWTDTTVGASSYAAKARRGHGASIFSASTRRAAVAVGVEVPGRKTIFILGSWDEPSPTVEKQFVDLVRGIGRCKHKPNRGCVPVMPAGAEDELPNPPKAGPGSSPFG